MAETPIEWADTVWNPTTGCSKVSSGCKNCYAAVMHKRLTGMGSAKYQQPFSVVTTHKDALTIPLRWKKPRTIFVNSMSDLFHEDVPNEFIDRMFAVMTSCDRHEYLILTKRAKRMKSVMLDSCEAAWTGAMFGYQAVMGIRQHVPSWPPQNIRLGVSIEDQQRADERLPHLMELAAAGWKTMVSAEPLLGPVDLWPWLPRNDYCAAHDYGDPGYPPSECVDCGTIPGLGWGIVGCESGQGRRPTDIGWIRSIRDQCRGADIPFFLKQMDVDGRLTKLPELDGVIHNVRPEAHK